MEQTLTYFLSQFKENIKNGKSVKLTISNKRNKSNQINSIYVKPVQLRVGLQLSFVYRYVNKDITKNFDIDEGFEHIYSLISEEYKQADLFTARHSFHLMVSKKGTVNIKKKELANETDTDYSHDNKKQRILDLQDSAYLRELNIISGEGKVKPGMSDKFVQINKYIEIIDGILKKEAVTDEFCVVDMGSGKGYLTFALYDYLHNKLNVKAKVIGVEMRPELVDYCNNVAQKVGFDNLEFVAGEINDVSLPSVDMLIALHACDTATDDAIFRGIQSKAKIIVCAPCCYKQIRPQIKSNNVLQLTTKHGILCERQAEIVTDAIRAAILEAYAYKTKVFEFIATEHTPKNVLIVGVKRAGADEQNSVLVNEIQELKKLFGIEKHYLEEILKISM